MDLSKFYNFHQHFYIFHKMIELSWVIIQNKPTSIRFDLFSSQWTFQNLAKWWIGQVSTCNMPCQRKIGVFINLTENCIDFIPIINKFQYTPTKRFDFHKNNLFHDTLMLSLYIYRPKILSKIDPFGFLKFLGSKNEKSGLPSKYFIFTSKSHFF